MTQANLFPRRIENESQLEDLLSVPTEGAVKTVSQQNGDYLLLGVGGKMGPTLARMIKRAAETAQKAVRVIGVSRFSDPRLSEKLNQWGIETISCDLLEEQALNNLPDVENVIYMAGWKFGSTGQEFRLWAMNTYLPALVAQRYKNARIVAFSTGNVYPFTAPDSGGPTEEDPPGPVGEYAQSCLGRERIFEYFSDRYGTPVTLIRLNYAVEMRYGVLLDIGQKVYAGIPVPLSMGYTNVIWQGDANAQTIQCFDLCQSPVKVINITGSEIVPVRRIAHEFGTRFNKEPQLEGREEPTALLSNATQARQRFGLPSISVDQLIDWIAHWIETGGTTYSKPTHFEIREGKF